MRQYTWLVGLILVILLAALAAQPFLSRPGLPRDTDAELHVFRAAELGYALQGGAGYVRWAPNFWYGYGYPIFNYYAPLCYYLANAFALLPNLDIVSGTKAVFILGLLLGALGTFSLGRKLFGLRAALVAAAAFTFSPYILFVNPHMRGDLPEFFALSLLPWLIRFQIQNSKFKVANFVLSAFLWTALILTHNLMALILSAILAVWLLWQLNFKPRVSNLGLVLLVAGLSAFFWLPFVAERSAVHLTVIGEGHFDFHNHFVAWRTLFGPSQPLDMGATSPKFQYNLGLAQWLLALPALPLAFLYRHKPQGKVLAFFVLCSLVLILLMLSPSAFIWEAVPLMSYIQFPWRLLGPAALTLAMCMGGAIWGIEETTKQESKETSVLASRILHLASCILRPSSLILHPSFFILLILGLALPAMYPPMWSPDFGPTTPLGMLQVELAGHYLGTTSTGDFVPATVKAHPPANSDLVASYQQGNIDKFDRATLPSGATAKVIEHGPTHDRFQVYSPQSFAARVLTFYFPGWQVKIDGQPVSIRPSDPHGLIEFDIAPGAHDIVVSFGSTPARTIGTFISLLALVFVGLWIAISKFKIGAAKIEPQGQACALKFKSLKLGPEIVVVLAFILFKFAIADPCDTCFRYTSPPGQVLGAQHTLSAPVDFGHHIELLGYGLPSTQVQSGGKLALTLYWKAATPVPKNYQVFAHLVRPITTLWGQSDKLNPGDFPTSRWPLDKFVWDDHTLTILPGTPPGEYQLGVGLYTLADGARAPIFDASGQIVADSLLLPVTIRVLPARTDPSSLEMDKRQNMAYNGATLLGHTLESAEVRAPGFVRITLFWQATQNAPSMPARVQISLVDAQGQPTTQIESEPAGGIYPPTQWKRGQIVRDIYSLWLGEQSAAGTFTVRVKVDDGQAIDLATVQISK